MLRALNEKRKVKKVPGIFFRFWGGSLPGCMQKRYLVPFSLALAAATVQFCGCASRSAKTPPAETPLYAVAETPAPVLNTWDFPFVFGGRDGKSLHLDKSGLIRELEFIALTGTVFKIRRMLAVRDAVIYEVASEEYPYPSDNGYYVDSRFVRVLEQSPPARAVERPARKQVVERLLALEGVPYLWGGNHSQGVPQMLLYYEPSGPIDPRLAEKWTLKGLDCSGLLYEATGGFTPRNARGLVDFGDPVKIAGLKAEAITAKLEPLDLIASEDHVIIVLDNLSVIESCLDHEPGIAGNQGGVRVKDLRDVIEHIMTERTAADSYRGGSFVIRRWEKLGSHLHF